MAEEGWMAKVRARWSAAALVIVATSILVALVVPDGASARPAAPAPAAPIGDYATSIIGGSEAPEGWTFIAALIRPGSGNDYERQFCGGSLITPTYVLTAAHCAVAFASSPTSLRVVIGRRDLYGTDGDDITARSVTIHPRYTGAVASYDVALIELSRPSTQARIPMMQASVEPIWNTDYEGVLAGWGSVAPAGDVYPSKLQSGRMPIWSDAYCASHTSTGYAAARHLCAGSPTISGCFGDSGGPLLAVNTNGETVITGVVSYGPTYCTDWPGVYSQVSAYQSWITSTTGEAVAPMTTTTRPPRTTTTSTTTVPTAFVAHLDAAQQVPAPRGVTSAATGELTATLTGTRLVWSLTVSGLTGDPTAARINLGDPGHAGSVLVTLARRFTSSKSGSISLKSSVVNQLRSGRAYLSVTTARNRAGEIRGQITATS